MTTAPGRGRRVLILHGFENHRPVGHWHRLLAESLRADDEHVVYPQLPCPDDPAPDDWLEVLTTELALLGDPARLERVVIAHSLGCILWLHACAREVVVPPVDRVLLVAPPGPEETARSIPAFTLPQHPTAAQVAAAATSTLLVCGDADPWCAVGAEVAYGAPLRIDTQVVPGVGHLSLDDGFGAWPEVRRWIDDPGTSFATSAAVTR